MKNIKSLSKYLLYLCPRVYGADIKAKISDSWFNDLPVVLQLWG